MRLATDTRRSFFQGCAPSLPVAAVAMLAAAACSEGCRSRAAPTGGADARAAARPPVLHALEGTATDGSGEPLPDVLVMVWPAGEKARSLLDARTGGDGRFVAGGLRAGSWTLLADAPGFGTLALDRVEVPSRPLVLRFEGRSRNVGGVVVDGAGGGRGRPGATVTLGSASVRTERTAQSDAHGAFLFKGLGNGRFTVRASLGNLVSRSASVVLDDEIGWVPPFRLALARGGFVRGRVRGDAAGPLPGAPIQAVAVDADELAVTSPSDAQGGFLIGPLPPGAYQVLARVPGHVPVESPRFDLRADTTTEIDLRLPRAATLSGQVIDDRGKPVMRASITATATGGIGAEGDDIAVLPGPLPLAAEAAELPGDRLLRQGRVRATATDEHGRFAIEDMLPGRNRLEIRHPDRLPKNVEPIFLAAGEQKGLGEILMAEGVLVEGRVLDETGVALAAARLEVRPEGRRGGKPVQVGAEDAGRFALRVPLGRYALRAFAPGQAQRSPIALDLTVGGARAPIDVHLLRADGSIEGMVCDAQSRRPIRGSHVVAYAAPDDAAGGDGTPFEVEGSGGDTSPALHAPLGAATTDGSGAFRIAGLPGGALVVEARHRDWPTAAVLGRAGARLTVALARPGAVAGEVRDETSRTLIVPYRIEASGPGGRRPGHVGRTGAGAFEITGLVPGRWNLRVHAPGYAPRETEIDVPPGAGAGDVSLRGLRVALRRIQPPKP